MIMINYCHFTAESQIYYNKSKDEEVTIESFPSNPCGLIAAASSAARQTGDRIVYISKAPADFIAGLNEQVEEDFIFKGVM